MQKPGLYEKNQNLIFTDEKTDFFGSKIDFTDLLAFCSELISYIVLLPIFLWRSCSRYIERNLYNSVVEPAVVQIAP